MASLGITPEDVSLVGTFRNFLQSQNINPNSILGGVAQRMQDPLFGGFALGQLSGFNQPGPAGPQQFGQFLGSGVQNIQRNAPQILDQIARGTGAVSPAAQSELGSAAPGNTAGGLLEDLARLGLRNQLSGSVASLFGNSLINRTQGNFEQQLANSVNTPGITPSYAGYLRQQLGFG